MLKDIKNLIFLYLEPDEYLSVTDATSFDLKLYKILKSNYEQKTPIKYLIEIYNRSLEFVKLFTKYTVIKGANIDPLYIQSLIMGVITTNKENLSSITDTYILDKILNRINEEIRNQLENCGKMIRQWMEEDDEDELGDLKISIIQKFRNIDSKSLELYILQGFQVIWKQNPKAYATNCWRFYIPELEVIWDTLLTP
jgi:hypothetical protein